MAKLGVLGAFETHEFLSGLSDRHLMKLATASKPFSASPLDVLTRKGDAANSFFLIKSGYVEVGNTAKDGSFVAISKAGPGDVIGWSWILPPHRWQFDCRAIDAVQGLSLDARSLREQCETDHELGYHLMKHLLGVVAGRLASAMNSSTPAEPVTVVNDEMPSF